MLAGAAGAGRRPGLPPGPRVPNLRKPGRAMGLGAAGGGGSSSSGQSRRSSPGRWRGMVGSTLLPVSVGGSSLSGWVSGGRVPGSRAANLKVPRLRAPPLQPAVPPLGFRPHPSA